MRVGVRVDEFSTVLKMVDVKKPMLQPITLSSHWISTKLMKQITVFKEFIKIIIESEHPIASNRICNLTEDNTNGFGDNFGEVIRKH
jgi:hypothetical protein